MNVNKISKLVDQHHQLTDFLEKCFCTSTELKIHDVVCSTLFDCVLDVETTKSIIFEIQVILTEKIKDIEREIRKVV